MRVFAKARFLPSPAAAAMLLMRLGFVLAVAWLHGYASGQDDGKPPRIRPTEHNKAASKFIRLLELPSRRTAAIQGLFSIGGDAALDLARAVGDPRPEVARTAAHILRMLGTGSEAALPILRELANSDNANRAFLARWVIAGLSTGGVLLVSCATRGELLELNQKGETKFSMKTLQQVFDAERLANGNYLVCSYRDHLVQEITREGKVVWKYKGAKSPMDVDRLPSGNTLIADITGRVIEVNTAGKVVWSFKTQSSYEAERLPNGNTLISEHRGNRVLEVDPKGEVVWQHSISQPMGIQRLPSGNTLVASFAGRVVEIDAQGKTVFEFKSPQSYGVLRLANGDTLVTSSRGLTRHDPQGKEIWVKNLGTVGSVQIY